MPKVKDEIQTNADITYPQENTAETRVMELEERNKMLLESQQALVDRISRLEFAGGDKNKQRQWDSINGKNKNIKFGRIPSSDGKIPIVDWYAVAQGRSYVDLPTDHMIDTQSWVITTKDGKEMRKSLDEITPLLAGNSIPARCNNWLAYLNAQRDISVLRHEYQLKAGSDVQFNTVQALKEINDKERGIVMNVTLSLDNGKTYTGETFDILAKMWNAFA